MNKAVSLIVFISTLVGIFLLYSDQSKSPFLEEVPSNSDCYPRLVRMNLGDKYSYTQIDNNDVTITFQTFSRCDDASVTVTQNGKQTKFTKQVRVHSLVDQQQFCHGKLCEKVSYDQHIHHFLIQASPGSFEYTVSGDLTGSVSQGPFNAHLPNRFGTSVQKFIFLGDFDQSYLAQATWNFMGKLQQSNDQIDAVIFLGDYAYEFWQNNGKQGDDYLQQLQPYAATKPWMMSAGNHEDNFNFTFYNDKFRMPNYDRSNNHFYSFDVGLVHFVHVDLHYYNDGSDQLDKSVKASMRDWVIQDLQKANANRHNVPWIIAYGHKAVYCFSSECDDFPNIYHYWDDIFYTQGVDLFLGAHKHEYQMIKPIYQQNIKPFGKPNDNTIVDPQATVYIIQGNAGNRNMEQDGVGKHPEWLLKEDGNTGIGKMTVTNANEITLEYYQSSTQNLNHFYKIQKSSHKPFQ